jgi:hypothetical protein
VDWVLTARATESGVMQRTQEAGFIYFKEAEKDTHIWCMM